MKQIKAKTTTKGTKKTPRRAARKVSDETNKPTITTERHGSASVEIEAIEAAAGDVGTVAHSFFFTVDNLPAFLRDACADAITRACYQLNIPNPDETPDDLVAFQQMVDLFKATGEKFELTDSRGEVAELIAAVVAHPKVPQSIWDALTDALVEMDDTTDKYENPEVVREVIRQK